MTVINPNSISGITSITMPSGDGNVLTVHTNDGVERFRIDSSGNVKVGSACTISPDGDVFFTGVTTATTFTGAHSGSGANLTNLPAANLTGTLPAISGANLTGIAATDNVRTGILDVAGISTFRNTMNVGAAVTISESGIEASGIGITVANINGNQIGGRRNIMINGNMVCAQRGTSITFADSTYSLDRWLMRTGNHSGAATITQESSVTPDGFQKSLKVDITTADTSLTGGEYFFIDQRIEANNVHHAAYGNSGAKTMTLSFYVRSNKTGTYNVHLYNPSSTRHISRSYTINSADTWERKILRIPGDTSGGLTTGTGAALRCNWYLAAGTSYTSGSVQTTWSSYNVNNTAPSNVNLLDSTSNEWYLTGVQLEIGSEATPFEHRSFGEEIHLCERYYRRDAADGVVYYRFAQGQCTSSSGTQYVLKWPTRMRAAPTYATSGTITAYTVNSQKTTSSHSLLDQTTQGAISSCSASGLSAGNCVDLIAGGDGDAYVEYIAEL